MESELLWAAALGSLVVGIGVGFLLARRSSRKDAARVRELTEQLAASEADHARYRGQVADHFNETSRRLRDLTLQYKSVYEHLADGARTLCPDGAVEIAATLTEAIPAAADPMPAAAHPAEADDNQLDLELEPPDRWSARDGEDDLGPLLDDDVPPARDETGRA